MAQFQVTCPRCHTACRIEDGLLGKKVRCPKKECAATFVPTRTTGGLTPRRLPPAGRSEPADGVPVVWDPGDVLLGLYEVKGVLGEGGMGTVYRVRHRGWALDLAVKTPRPQLLSRPGAAEDFEREAETWVNLGLHPHTAACFYVRRLGGLPRVFAELVAGGSLRDWIDGGRLYEGGPRQALARVLDVAIQFCWGLHHAHGQGLVHQDVKPANVLMTPDGTAKVTDFGLARARAAAGEDSSPAAAPGQSVLVSSGGMTPAYCSPEQAGRQKLTRRTDVYSWAVSVLEMFAGEVTWPSGTVAGDALEAYLEAGPDGRLPPMPPALADLLRRCLRHDPAGRPQDLKEVADALEGLYRQAAGAPYPRRLPRPGRLLADSRNNQAVSHLELRPDRHEEATRLLQEALAADPSHPEASYNLGLLRWRAGEWTDAALVVRLEEVHASQGGRWLSAYLLALAQLERGECAAALAVLEGITGEAGRLPEVQAALTRARAEQGRARVLLRTFEGHPDAVRAASLGADGRLAASGTADGTVRLFAAATGRLLRQFKAHPKGLTALTLGADGRLLLTAGRDPRPESAPPPTGRARHELTLRLWDVRTGACLRTLRGHTGWRVAAVCLSADGRRAVSGGDGQTVRIWDVETGQCLRALEGHTTDVCSVSLSADGRRVLSGATQEARLWDAATGRCLRTLSEKREGDLNVTTTQVALSPDGRRALSGTPENTVKVWDTATGEVLHTLEGHKGTVTALAVGPGGRLAATGAAGRHDDTVRLWEVATGRCLRTFEGHPGGVSAVALGADGRLILSAGRDKALRLWGHNADDPATRAPFMVSRPAEGRPGGRDPFEDALEKAERALAADPVAAAREVRKARAQPGCRRRPEAMHLWQRLYLRLPRAGLADAWPLHVLDAHPRVARLALTADARRALTAGADGRLRLWDVARGEALRTFEGEFKDLKSVALSPDGRLALSGTGMDGEKALRLWDAGTGKSLHTFTGFSWMGVGGAGFSPDSRLAFSLSGHTIALWDVATRRALWASPEQQEGLMSGCFSPDGRLILTGATDATVQLWEVSTGRCLRRLRGSASHAGSLCLCHGVAFSADGRLALSGSGQKTAADCVVDVWDLVTGKCLRTLPGAIAPVSSVAVTGDGRFAFAGAWDQSVRVYDLGTGECVRTFRGQTRDVTGLGLSPDGAFAVLTGYTGKLEVWALDWELAEATPAARPGSPL